MLASGPVLKAEPMTDGHSESDGDLTAGGFSSWVRGMQAALDGERSSDVPCDGCTACCTSSQFVHIAPDETDTLSRIPAELLFAAPGLPRGHVLLGYDERGTCPMLVDNRCSIYEHRPRTCRTYDCRIFPAAGVEVGDGTKALIAGRARRWRFSFPTTTDVVEHGAVRAAASFLTAHPELVGDSGTAPDVTKLAVMAVEVHDAFVGHDEETGPSVIDPEAGTVAQRLKERSEHRGSRVAMEPLPGSDPR